ncbi:MAG: hypothetical protein HYS57_02655 [Parcubacteria group bacterium]|nr:hypothetical protein [Parcubacteria group bacterium]
MKRATFVWASRLVAPLAFFLLGELVLVFPDTFRLGPWVLVIGIPLFSVVAWRLREDGWRRMLAGMFPVLVLVTLFWSRWWMGQLVLMFSFVGYAVVISRLHLPRVDPKELFRAAAFFYLFLVFLNFYIFSLLPITIKLP